MEIYRIEWAAERDADAVYALYHSLIDAPYSTWSEDYPTKEDVQRDISGGKTLVMRDEHGQIVSAIALLNAEDEPEFEGIAPWDPEVACWAIPSRLGVSINMQGRGIAGRMLEAAMEAAKKRGCDGVRFLVAKSNPIAQRAYRKFEFDICGEHEMWGHAWLCYQKRL